MEEFFNSSIVTSVTVSSHPNAPEQCHPRMSPEGMCSFPMRRGKFQSLETCLKKKKSGGRGDKKVEQNQHQRAGGSVSLTHMATTKMQKHCWACQVLQIWSFCQDTERLFHSFFRFLTEQDSNSEPMESQQFEQSYSEQFRAGADE